MSGLEAVVLILGVLALYFFVTGFMAWRRALRYRREFRVEQTRSYWAEARHRLVELVRDGKIRHDSSTFRELYRIHTFVLRRPEDYQKIAEGLARFSPSGPPPEWITREMGEWPEELRDVFDLMGKGAVDLVFLHQGWFGRAVIVTTFGYHVARAVSSLAATKLMERLLPKVKPSKSLHQASQGLDRLAHV